jgi:hypothetical protein
MEETWGGNVINKSNNSRLSLYVLASIRFADNKGLMVTRRCPQPESRRIHGGSVLPAGPTFGWKPLPGIRRVGDVHHKDGAFGVLL